jgi:hydroxypyruvate reductase
MAEAANPGGAERARLRRIFQQALAAGSISRAFQPVQVEAGALRVGSESFALPRHEPVRVIALGKAAHTMVEALVEGTGLRLAGIVAAPTEPRRRLDGLAYFRGGHPLPDAASVEAGQAALSVLRGLTPDSLVLFLLSGGGSAVLERPLDALSLDDLIATYRVLVHAGAPIAEINALRKHLSQVKGGRLARAAHPARQLSLMISDVPDGALDSLASGPTMPDTTTVTDCYRIAERYGMLEQFPASVRQIFAERRLEETPKGGDPVFAGAHWTVLLANQTARQAALRAAADEGYAVAEDNACDDWDYAKAADYLLQRLRALRRRSARACLVSGGEVTVRVTGRSGEGGRNQQFALYCAQRIAGKTIAVLSAGTDGIDGNSRAAGAVVDGTTQLRADAKGLSVAQALADFNAFPLLDALGDAILTGPTGNNVRDLRVLLSW